MPDLPDSPSVLLEQLKVNYDRASVEHSQEVQKWLLAAQISIRAVYEAGGLDGNPRCVAAMIELEKLLK